MSISDLHPRQTPAAVLAEAVALLRDMGSAWWTHQPHDQVVAAVELGAELRSVTAAVEAAAVAEADHRALAKDTLHYGSTGDWLTHVGGLRKGQGRRIVARAHAVTGPLATTRDAMAAGRVSPEQADVIVQAIDQLRMGEALRVRGERVLLEQTGCLDASDLARTGRHPGPRGRSRRHRPEARGPAGP